MMNKMRKSAHKGITADYYEDSTNNEDESESTEPDEVTD